VINTIVVLEQKINVFGRFNRDQPQHSSVQISTGKPGEETDAIQFQGHPDTLRYVAKEILRLFPTEEQTATDKKCAILETALDIALNQSQNIMWLGSKERVLAELLLEATQKVVATGPNTTRPSRI
jgi:hypothetical protein